MKRIRGYWKQFWEDRFMNSNRRFTHYVNEWIGMCETGYDRKRARTLLRKEKKELILQKVYLFFMNGNGGSLLQALSCFIFTASTIA